MAKTEMCGLHCPKGMLWLFAALGAWFALSAVGIPVFGGFWAWLVLLSGVCMIVCASDKKHQQTSCPFAGLPVWMGWLAAVVGAWFLLGDLGVLPTFGMSLLHVVTAAGAAGLALHRR